VMGDKHPELIFAGINFSVLLSFFINIYRMSNSNGKYALITGGTNGIGYELAKLFAQDGYNLVIVARDRERLEQVADKFSRDYRTTVIPIAKDLFQREAASEIYAELQMKEIRIDVLVNDAGQGQHGYFADSDLQRIIDMIQLNIISLVTLTKLFLTDMLQRNEGKILNLASIASLNPSPLLAVYAATKAFVLSFSEALADELKETKVTMTALLPGATDTDFFSKADGENTKEYQESSLSNPSDVAKDGYEALMKGEVKVVSGMKNKLQAAMSNVIPDSKLAATMHKKMEEPK
jgi:short-subunit dehydrogenase